jgi:hypothetical protein
VGRADLHVEDESLREFANRLNRIHETLRERRATGTRVSTMGATPNDFGHAATAMDELHRKYESVRSSLESLVRDHLRGVEALAIMTELSRRGYEGVEAEQVERLRQIMSGWEQRYSGRPERSASANEPAAHTPAPDNGGGGGAAASML